MRKRVNPRRIMNKPYFLIRIRRCQNRITITHIIKTTSKRIYPLSCITLITSHQHISIRKVTFKFMRQKISGVILHSCTVLKFLVQIFIAAIDIKVSILAKPWIIVFLIMFAVNTMVKLIMCRLVRIILWNIGLL